MSSSLYSKCLHWDVYLTQYITNAEKREMRGKTQGERGERKTAAFEMCRKKAEWFLCMQLAKMKADRYSLMSVGALENDPEMQAW